jgi:hypothetical protein
MDDNNSHTNEKGFSFSLKILTVKDSFHNFPGPFKKKNVERLSSGANPIKEI